MWICKIFGHKYLDPDYMGKVHDFCLRCGAAHD